VFVDGGLHEDEDEENDRMRFATDNFFFKRNDAHSISSSLMYDDESCERSKEIYGYRDE